MTTRRRFLAGLGCAGGALLGYSRFSGSYGKPTIDKDIDIIGHRGASAKFSDNSIEGIRYAGKHVLMLWNWIYEEHLMTGWC